MAFTRQSRGPSGRKGGKTFGGKKPWDRGNDRGGFGGRSHDRPEMYPATCTKCHQPCEVPFKPYGNKPVFCSDCFKRDDDRPSTKPAFERSSGGYSPDAKNAEKMKEQFNILNAKLDIIIKVLTEAEE